MGVDKKKIHPNGSLDLTYFALNYYSLRSSKLGRPKVYQQMDLTGELDMQMSN